MTTFSEFERALLVGAYEISDETGNDFVELKAIFHRYDIFYKPGWPMKAVRSLIESGYSDDVRHIGNELDQSIALTPSGFKKGEDLRRYTILRLKETPRREALPHADNGRAPEPVTDTTEAAAHIDSAEWTGLRQTRVSADNREKVRTAIGEARHILENQQLSNEQKAQALSLLRAAENLVDAPEPPSDLIWDLIYRAAAVCGILGLFLTLFLAAV